MQGLNKRSKIDDGEMAGTIEKALQMDMSDDEDGNDWGSAVANDFEGSAPGKVFITNT